jgi:hypothetical protein
LLLFFLRYPTKSSRPVGFITVAGRTSYVYREGERLSEIAGRYRPAAIQREAFSVETILLANPPVCPFVGNGMSLPDGTILVIPDQKQLIARHVPINKKRTWWRPIMEKRKWEGLKRRDKWCDETSGRDVFVSYHTLKRLTEAEVRSFIEEAEAKRKELEERYQVRWC